MPDKPKHVMINTFYDSSRPAYNTDADWQAVLQSCPSCLWEVGRSPHLNDVGAGWSRGIGNKSSIARAGTYLITYVYCSNESAGIRDGKTGLWYDDQSRLITEDDSVAFYVTESPLTYTMQ